MSEKNVPLRAALLEACIRRQEGISELSRRLRAGPAGVIHLVEEMEGEGLVRIGKTRGGRVGRPRKRVDVTALGKEYLSAYGSLTLKTLRSRRPDLLRAAADGRYAQRLTSRKVSTYRLFMELESIAERPRRTAG